MVFMETWLLRKGSVGIKIEATIVVFLVLLFRTVCKTHSINCTIFNDPYYIPHKFYQPGNFLIGAIASQVFGFHSDPSFIQEPMQTPDGRPM